MGSTCLETHGLAYPQASLWASSLPIPQPSKDQSTCLSCESQGCFLGLLYSGMSSTRTTLEAGSTSRRCATCPCSQSWRSQTESVTVLNSVSQCSYWFDTRSFQWYSMILQRLAPKASMYLSKSVFSDHVSQKYSKTRSTSDLKIQTSVCLHRHWQHQTFVLSELITLHVKLVHWVTSW